MLFDSQGVRHVSNLKQNKETPRHFFRVAKQRGTGSLGSAATVAADPEDKNENKKDKKKEKKDKIYKEYFRRMGIFDNPNPEVITDKNGQKIHLFNQQT